MNVLVCGSREWTDRKVMRFVLSDELTKLDPGLHYDITILHGACRGADLMAADLLKHSIYTLRAFPADWKTHGRKAGILRNLAMLDENPVLVLAFVKGESRGTRHTIGEAQRRGIRTVVTISERVSS